VCAKNEGELYYKEQINVKRLNPASYFIERLPETIKFDFHCFFCSIFFVLKFRVYSLYYMAILKSKLL